MIDERPRPGQTVTMELLVVDHDTVTDLLTLDACLPVMRDALIALSRGDGFQPLRATAMPPGLAGFLVLMPGHLAGTGRPGTGAPHVDAGAGVLGIKLLGIFPGNPARGEDAHQGAVLLLDPETGAARAVVNATPITAVRTAAVSALATRALARPDATTLAVLGTGVQARWHVRAIATERALTSVRLHGRDPHRTAEVAAELTAETGVPVEAAPNARDAVDGAGIVVTATTSRTPVLEHGWLAAGTHVNAVGACLPADRELPTATVAAARFVVDRRESALAEAGDFRLAAAEAGLAPEHIAAELGEVLAGTVPGRTDPDQLTVFESLGLAVEDLAAARYVVDAARAAGRGTPARF